MKNKSQQGTQDFKVENPLQQREVKIRGVFTNAVDNLMM
jgi:hypothetical protein